MEISLDLNKKYNGNFLLSDTFLYELPSNLERVDLLATDIIMLYTDHPGGYKIEQRLLDENNNLLIKATSTEPQK
ncbi:hypothetical protein [Paenibacillus donghaensis]|uniref:Uncharacterized protein n=1 Tax=Paenibacillus donghaensis TaxID=414771 RepID=A0A2Z2KPW5_9BACL|nr:hypothetical protein [Paenibacillus donghaensis]ASA22311.1 hypothetical protein B9T62_16870 [Paenibacillus donghaensis]